MNQLTLNPKLIHARMRARLPKKASNSSPVSAFRLPLLDKNHQLKWRGAFVACRHLPSGWINGWLHQMLASLHWGTRCYAVRPI